MKPPRIARVNLLAALALLATACQASRALPSPTAAAPTSPPAAALGPGPCTRAGDTWTSPQDGMVLVCVPAGEFLMGAAGNDTMAADNEKPQHTVYLDAYWIDRTEVTNADYARCMAADRCHPKVYETTAADYTPYAVHPAYQSYPAVVYEYEAVAEYCRWVERRLPTEAEWEKAARGTDGRIYPWGGDLDCNRANYFFCSEVTNKTPDPTGPRCGYGSDCKTTPVDAYPAGASPYGALNMAGNVWEWVSDWYQADYYGSAPARNPSGPATGKYRVLRGGGATSLTQDLRVTRRVNAEPQHFLDGQQGFRCAAAAN